MYIGRSDYLTSRPVMDRPMSIRWISDVPSKIVNILEVVGRVISIPARPSIGPYGWGCPSPVQILREEFTKRGY